MPLDNAILREVESAEFAWELGLSGSRARAMQALVRAPRAKALLSAVAGNDDAARVVANRIVSLVGSETDPRYTHPFDAAIAAYLRTLDLLFPDLAAALGPFVARQRQNLWWSIPVVDRLLRGSAWTESTGNYATNLYRKQAVATQCKTGATITFPVPSAKGFVATFAKHVLQGKNLPVDPSSSSGAEGEGAGRRGVAHAFRSQQRFRLRAVGTG